MTISVRTSDLDLWRRDHSFSLSLANMSAAEAKKLRNKNRKQQMREQQEKQKQLEVERRKKEIQRIRNKDDGDEEKVKEDEINAEKLERVRLLILSASPILTILILVWEAFGRSDALFAASGRFRSEYARHSLSRFWSLLSAK